MSQQEAVAGAAPPAEEERPAPTPPEETPAFNLSDEALERFGIDITNLGLMATAPEEFLRVSRSQTFQVGGVTKYLGSINGIDVPAETFFHEYPLLNRLVIQRHKPRNAPADAEPGWAINGMISAVRADHWITIENQKIPLETYLLALTNKRLVQLGHDPIDMEYFLEKCSEAGQPFKPVPRLKDPGFLVMMYQHFTPNMDVVNKLKKLMLDSGAVNAMDTIRDPRQITEAYQFREAKNPGLPILSLDIGKQDRSESQWFGRKVAYADGTEEVHPGQGYQNIIDGLVDNFLRGEAQRQARRALKAEHAKIDVTTLTPEQKTAMAREMSIAHQLAGNWMNSFGGATRRAVELAGGQYRWEDEYDPQNVPVGTFTLLVEGEPVEFNFWTRRDESQSTSGGLPTGVVDTTLEGSGKTGEAAPAAAGAAEDPF